MWQPRTYEAALGARDLAGVGVAVAPEGGLGGVVAGAVVGDGEQEQLLAVQRLPDLCNESRDQQRGV